MSSSVMNEAKKAMEKSIEAQKKELQRVRTGRASVSLLDDVMVDYYGTPTPLNQVGTLAIPEARLITIQPWEKNLIPEIERAIFKADLDLNPISDGLLIRLNLPPLTEERRKEMAKLVRRMAEDTKVAIRNARRDANEALKKQQKDKEISEDDQKRAEKEIQDLTDQFVKLADEVVDHKEKEIMEI